MDEKTREHRLPLVDIAVACEKRGETGSVIVEDRVGNVGIGQWYWVQSDKAEWLGCVVQVGSNYVELQEPSDPKHGFRSIRVHLDDFFKALRFEPNAQEVIKERINFYQHLSSKYLDEVKAVTARLGVSAQTALDQNNGQCQAMATLSSQPDVKTYEAALLQAKNKDLPELFAAIEDANRQLARWMSAETLPLQAEAHGLKSTLKEIDNRIFNVSLYAGLTEKVVQCCDGEPAAFMEKLHVMQRRLYMDEECLLNYKRGGMEFSDISEFDQWLSLSENRDRILPFPRCMVAMQVRRKVKDREADNILSVFININLKALDKVTFLYIRNGDRVYRLNCDLDFSELIFPDKAMFDPSEPAMVRMFADRVEKMITLREFNALVVEQSEKDARIKQWEKDNPKEQWEATHPGTNWSWGNPNRRLSGSFNPDEWEPLDKSNVYYDECMKEISDKIKQYNRIALIIQGLFDRSEALHPHPPVKTWTPEGFTAAVELVYDGSVALYHGEQPDFEAYRIKCNSSLNADSVVIGQDHYWQTEEAKKECRRRERDWRHNNSDYRPELFKPLGNPGPGYLAKMAVWKPRTHQAIFSWNRERLTDSCYAGKRYGDPIRTTITVPADELFNVSAYKSGDYKQFFQDPRTRADYLKWAPILLTAEEFCAGNAKVQEPVKE